MRILHLVPKAVFDTKLSRYRFGYVDYLNRHDQCWSHVSGPGWPDWDESRSPADNIARITVKPGTERLGAGEPADAVLAYKMDGLKDCGVPVVIAYNEADDQYAVRQEIERNGAHILIFHHANDLPMYRDLESRGLVLRHTPHCADPEVFQDYGLEKSTDILVVGNLQEREYHFRHRLMRLAIKTLKKRGWSVEVLPHPGYTLPPREGTFIGDAYAKKLNAAKLVFTCSMRYKYQLAKYSEIALSASLPVGDMPDECEICTKRLESMILRVEPWQTDEEIVRVVEDVLDDPDQLRTLTKRAWEIASRELTMPRYAERFVSAVRPHVEQWHRDQQMGRERASIAEQAARESRWREEERQRREREQAGSVEAGRA